MQIHGLDFTSAPSKRKPITHVTGHLTDHTLTINTLKHDPSFFSFEALLATPGEWVAGFDFPFGQPKKLIENLNLPQNWAQYVELIEQMGKREWVTTVTRYMNKRPPGDKLHFRTTDRIAHAQSPMKMHFIPVGRMFFEGARRLAASDVSVLPNRPTDSPRVVLEVYPALIARRFVGRGSGYKSDAPKDQTPAANNTRQVILQDLITHCPAIYGFQLHLTTELTSAMLTDPTGDNLDALLCAVQAAWGYTQRKNNYGIPPDIDPLEGWIVDPHLLEKYYA